MLFLRTNNINKRNGDSRLIISFEETMTINQSSTWLEEFGCGCQANSFVWLSTAQNQGNISNVGYASQSKYWYSSSSLSGDYSGSFAIYNESGALLTSQIISLPNEQITFSDIMITNNVSFIIGISSEKNIFIAKFDVTNNLIWMKKININAYADLFRPQITPLANDAYAILTSTYNNNNNNYFISIYTINNNGTILWAISLEQNTLMFSASAIAANGSAMAIVGKTFDNENNVYPNIPFIVIISEQGRLLQSTQFFLNSSNNNYLSWELTAIVSAYDQSYLAAGTILNNCNFGFCNMVTLHIDANGKLLLATEFLSSYGVTIYAMTSSTDASYTIAGIIYFNGMSCIIGQFNSADNTPIWIAVISNYLYMYMGCYSITSSSNGDLVVTGFAQRKQDNSYPDCAITIKVNEAGFVDLPSGFTYHNFTDQFTSIPLAVSSASLEWMTTNLSVSATDVTSSIPIISYDDFCAESNDLWLLITPLLVLFALGLCRLGWQDETRKVQAPWKKTVVDNTNEQRKQSMTKRKSSLTDSMASFPRLRRFSSMEHNTNESQRDVKKISLG